MSIIIYLGNPGSGKTACAVRDLVLNPGKYTTYTNIIPRKPEETPNMVTFTPDMLIKRELKGTKKVKGEEEPVYDLKLNDEYWKAIKEPINVVLDEAHTLLNARRAMSKSNVIMSDFLALIRRVLGQRASGYGDLILISQLWNRIDNIARDMATQIRFHICHYRQMCNDCQAGWQENSQMPEPAKVCPACKSSEIERYGFYIEVWHFASMHSFLGWKDFSLDTFYKHYYVTDIEDYFQYYDTLQWDNLMSNFY